MNFYKNNFTFGLILHLLSSKISKNSLNYQKVACFQYHYVDIQKKEGSLGQLSISLLLLYIFLAEARGSIMKI